MVVKKMKLRSFFGFFDWLQQVDWRRVKVKPFVSNSGGALRLQQESIQMPFNVFQDKDGLPRIVLTDPNGSSAEVCLFGVSLLLMILLIFFVKEKLDKQFIKHLYHKCL
jgi:hypothetical protein